MSVDTDVKKPAVLVVDDDVDLLDVLRTVLSRKYEVQVSPDGKTAIDMVQRSQPDLIVLDVMMPGMNGYEVCSWLKSRRQFNFIPIIMLTAKVAREDHIEGLGAGANAYVTKPFSLKEFNQCIGDQLERARKLRRNEWIQDWVEFTVTNEFAYLEELNDMVEQLFVHTSLSERTIGDITIAFREMLGNASEHGNRNDPTKNIYVSYMLLPDRFLLKIEDMGTGFDANAVPDPTSEENMLKDRGRGVFIVKHLMDEYYFSSNREPPDEDLAEFVSGSEGERKGQIVLMVKYFNE